MLNWHAIRYWQISSIRSQNVHARLLSDSKEVLFEFPPVHTNVGVIRKTLSGATKSYNFQWINIDCVFYSFTFYFLFVGGNVLADCFEIYIIHSLKEKYRLLFEPDVDLNHAQ